MNTIPNINCIIVEDEPLAVERVKSYIQKIPALHLSAVFDNGFDTLSFLKSNPVSLIFLDINIGELTGIQLLEATRIEAQVIIISAYQEFAIKGFELNVTDYLLKPYTFERFFQAVEKAQNNLAHGSFKAEAKYIFIKTEYRLEKILLDEILYIEGMRDYRQLHLLNRKVMTLQTFTELERQLSSQVVCRVHKSFMVAIDKIETIERNRIKIKDRFIPVSETYRKSFSEVINL